MLVAMCLVFVAALLLVVRQVRRLRRRRREALTSINLQGFRDEEKSEAFSTRTSSGGARNSHDEDHVMSDVKLV